MLGWLIVSFVLLYNVLCVCASCVYARDVKDYTCRVMDQTANLTSY